MWFMVLCHRGFYYYYIKLEVVPVPGVCSVSGREGRERFKGHAGQLECPISLVDTDPVAPAAGRDLEAWSFAE